MLYNPKLFFTKLPVYILEIHLTNTCDVSTQFRLLFIDELMGQNKITSTARLQLALIRIWEDMERRDIVPKISYNDLYEGVSAIIKKKQTRHRLRR